MKQSLTKEKIVKRLFYVSGLPSSMLEKFLDSLFKKIIEGTATEGSTKISNFGSFYLKNKKQRLGRNLNTNKEVVIEARNVVSFYPSKFLKKVVNE